MWVSSQGFVFMCKKRYAPLKIAKILNGPQQGLRGRGPRRPPLALAVENPTRER